MQLKVKEEHNNNLKAEVVSLTKKIDQKFELLDSRQDVPNFEYEGAIQKLETQLASTKQSLADKEQDLQDLTSQNEKKMLRKTKQFETEISDFKELITKLKNEVTTLKTELSNQEDAFTQV